MLQATSFLGLALGCCTHMRLHVRQSPRPLWCVCACLLCCKFCEAVIVSCTQLLVSAAGVTPAALWLSVLCLKQ